MCQRLEYLDQARPRWFGLGRKGGGVESGGLCMTSWIYIPLVKNGTKMTKGMSFRGKQYNNGQQESVARMYAPPLIPPNTFSSHVKTNQPGGERGGGKVPS